MGFERHTSVSLEASEDIPGEDAARREVMNGLWLRSVQANEHLHPKDWLKDHGRIFEISFYELVREDPELLTRWDENYLNNQGERDDVLDRIEARMKEVASREDTHLPMAA